MDKMYMELKENVENALRPITKKDNITPAEIEVSKNAVKLVNEIDKMCEKAKYDEEGYSQRMMDGHSYGDDPYRRWEILSYRGDGRSMAYPYYPTMTYGRDATYSHTGSDYSRHSIKDRAIDTLERLMSEASSEYERQKIKEYIRKVEVAE